MKNFKVKLSALIFAACVYMVFSLLWDSDPANWPMAVRPIAAFVGVTSLLFVVINPKNEIRKGKESVD